MRARPFLELPHIKTQCGEDLGPALRERAEDIPKLVKSFAEHYCAKHQRRNKRFLPELVSLLQTLPWPGNVRQLRNIVERLVVTIPRQTIGLENLPSALVC